MKRARRVLQIEAQAVSRMAERLDGRMDEAVRLILDCRSRVVVTGMGKSGIIGKKIASTLASTGTPAFFLHPAEGSHGDLGMVSRGDVAIALSNSGETEEVVMLLPVLKRMNLPVIAIVGHMDSALAREADVVLDATVEEEACPLGLAPTASTTAALAMGDALAMEVLDGRGFRREDFALFHPGGALGRRLILTAGDLMHGGDDVPRISADRPMRDVFMEISSKRLGMTTVIDAQGRLLGIVTDGDLRRGLEKWESTFLEMRAGEVMTENPKTIRPNTMAAEALGLMEQYEITALVVANEEGKVEGIVHMHDLLKAGIV